jgi:Mn-dependent DtxR family transcriptional regulator
MNAARSRLVLAAHLLRTMAAAQRDARRVDLDGLTREMAVRRADVRATLSSLHAEGLVDVLRMRLTMDGFTLGQSLEGRRLAPLRAVARARDAAAA